VHVIFNVQLPVLYRTRLPLACRNIQYAACAAHACFSLTQYNGRTYASFRVGVRFNSTNTTQVRDEMWNGIGSPGIAKPCSGGYNTILYKKRGCPVRQAQVHSVTEQ
jgi:hypothetical protein